MNYKSPLKHTRLDSLAATERILYATSASNEFCRCNCNPETVLKTSAWCHTRHEFGIDVEAVLLILSTNLLNFNACFQQGVHASIVHKGVGVANTNDHLQATEAVSTDVLQSFTVSWDDTLSRSHLCYFSIYKCLTARRGSAVVVAGFQSDVCSAAFSVLSWIECQHVSQHKQDA